MKFPIEGFLPEGITFISGLPDAGKTWLCLSMARAICTGQRFLGQFVVNEPSNVLYLVPESGERSFRHRMNVMGIPDDETFLCRTMSDSPIGLDTIELVDAVKYLNPVVFLDTVVRFNESENENDASQASRCLARNIHALLSEGAKSVTCVHHSTKASASQAASLENSLRGSGDLGAMADAVYSLKVEDRASLRVRIENVKARDFEPASPFVVEGRPSISENGDFRLVTGIKEPKFTMQERDDEQKFLSAITANPNATYDELDRQLSMTRGKVQRIAERMGWEKSRNAPWTRCK